MTNQDPTQEELHSILFANMVMQQGNMVMIFLGKVPHPETGQKIKELEAAKIFIDQLEMLAAKTKGNLSREEQELLNQTLTAVRLAYVEEAGGAPAPQPKIEEPTAPVPSEEEAKKKFVKRY